jgi:hypothetical protein
MRRSLVSSESQLSWQGSRGLFSCKLIHNHTANTPVLCNCGMPSVPKIGVERRSDGVNSSNGSAVSSSVASILIDDQRVAIFTRGCRKQVAYTEIV